MQDWLSNPGNIKKSIIIIAAILIVAPLIAFFSTHGYVTIESGDDMTVSLAPSSDTGNTITASKKISQFVGTGTYIAAASNGLSIIKKNIEVKPFSIIAETLNVPSAPAAQPVTNLDLSSISPSNSPYFIHNPGGHLSTIADDGTVRAVSTNAMLRSIRWVNGSEGYSVGTTDNSSSQLYHIKNGTLTSIALPQPVRYTAALPYTVARDGTVYIYIVDTLYKKTPDSSSFAPLWQQTGIIDLLSASSHSVVALTGKPSSDNPFASEIVYLNTSGRIMHSAPASLPETPDTRLYAEWNDDESKLLLVSAGRISIYDREFQQIDTLPESMSTSPHWSSGDTIVYAASNAILKYDLSSRQSSAVATLPSYVTAQQISTIDDDKYYVWGRTSVGVEIYRTGGESNSVADILSESNMQQLSGTCDMNYLNFSRLIIVYRTFAGKNSECESSIRDYLGTIRLDSTSIPLVAGEMRAD